MTTVAAIILAAGRSQRMGRNKLLVEIGDKPLVRLVAESVLASRANPVLVVTGHDTENVCHALAGCAVTIVHNPAFRSGLSGSIGAGVRALPDSADAVLIVLGDMPSVSTSLVDSMIDAVAGKDGRAMICVATRKGTRGNPVLFGRAYFPDLLSLTGDIGARVLVAANEVSVVEIEANNDGPFIDIDTPESLANFRAHPG